MRRGCTCGRAIGALFGALGAVKGLLAQQCRTVRRTRDALGQLRDERMRGACGAGVRGVRGACVDASRDVEQQAAGAHVYGRGLV